MDLQFAILQTIITAIACYGVWRLWLPMRKFEWEARIVAAGFLIRAFGGESLFWISYLRLPLLRSMQLGDGFWAFAPDAPVYFGHIERLRHLGPSFLSIDASYPSHTYVQIMTIVAIACGQTASIAILANCAAWLATALLILRMLPAGRSRRFAALAIALAPASIFCSFQLLKDTVFILLLVAFVEMLARWQRLWSDPSPGKGQIAAIAAGIRWYAAAFSCVLLAVFFTLVAARRLTAAVYCTITLLLSLQALRFGGSTD